MDITDEKEYLNQLINSEVSKFLPFTVFDKNLVSLKSGEKILRKLKSYYKEVNKNCLPKDGSPLLFKDLTAKTYNDCFETLSSKTQETIIRITKEYFFTIQTLGILTKDGNTVPLQTFNGLYNQGNSICHPEHILYDEITIAIEDGRIDFINSVFNSTNLKYTEEAVSKYYDDNYILYYIDNDDLTVEDMEKLLPNNENHPLTGNGIVEVMKTLGWTEKGKRKSNKTYYLDESINIPESNDFKYFYMKKYEISNQHNANSTEIESEIFNAYSMEEEPTFSMEDKPTFPIEEVEKSSYSVNKVPTF